MDQNCHSDLNSSIFASAHELAFVKSAAAQSAAGRRSALQQELLEKFPDVTEQEFMRILIKCPRCEHAISVGKFLVTQNCTQCGSAIVNFDGMCYLALKGILRMSKRPTADFVALFSEMQRANYTG